MKNASSLNTNSTESPKTPGGISKYLLTPCRRLGLSRNWKKGGVSPFVSPLSSGDVKQNDVDSRKRKERVEDSEKTPDVANTNQIAFISEDTASKDVDKTPSRSVDIPRRKRSKTLLTAINKTHSNADSPSSTIDDVGPEKTEHVLKHQESMSIDTVAINNNEKIDNVTELVSTPVRLKSKTRSKKYTSIIKKEEVESKNDSHCEIKENVVKNMVKEEVKFIEAKSKQKSPNDLTRECMVVIQKKLYKELDVKTDKAQENNENITLGINTQVTKKSESNTLNNSNTDNVPLCHLKKKDNEIIPKYVEQTITIIDDDDDFTASETKIKKVNDNNIKNSKATIKTCKNNKIKNTTLNALPSSALNQSQSDDDDDFDFDKKTILIRKTYEKVHKPLKAKSTGSITQRDIDDLKTRIESKKKLLLAKAMTSDTKELRDLIKKWQKGCQDALMELMDLMKIKCPDKSNMDYSEILQTLKIPPTLVGYDAENDTFNTPDDASIILANVNDL